MDEISSTNNNQHTNEKPGILKPGMLAAVCAAALFGISTPVSKVLLGEIPPLFLAGLLYLGSGIGLTFLYIFNLIFRPKKEGAEDEAPLGKGDYLWLAGAILCGGVIAPIFNTLGISKTTGSAASLLLNLEGILTALVAFVIFKEAVGKKIWIAAAAMFLGGILLSYQPQNMSFSLPLGSILVAGACMMWAFDNNLTRNLSDKDPFVIARTKGLIAGSVSLCISFFAGEKFGGLSIPEYISSINTANLKPVIGALILGAFSYGISLVLFVYALRHLGSARTGALFGTGPFVGALVSVIILKDSITSYLAFAALFMAAGAYFLLKEDHEHEHTHEHITHDHRHTHDEHHHHEHQGGIAPTEPHSHPHTHEELKHSHAHTPDVHHRHYHEHVS